MRNKRTQLFSIVLICMLLLVSGCKNQAEQKEPTNFTQEDLLSEAPNGVYYEIFVRAFYDSDGDGIGDLKGATEKLDYLKDLGIEGIWLMPINPSPSYHGYDITNYKEINPDYGTMDDFKTFVDEAHKRDIKVIMDLVVNHTSKDHPWFKEATKSNTSPYHNYYVWADENTNTSAPGEWGQKAWHSYGSATYEGIFWEGMPDLNYDNPKVRSEIKDIGQFWLQETGVDGFRLDAAKHIYSNSEEKDHEWWREFRTAMNEVNPDAFLVGEVWDSPTIVGPYLQDGLTSAFNFDLAGKIVTTAKNESDSGVVSTLSRVRDYFTKVSGGTYIDSTFLTNHDMNRVMSELNGNIDHAKMAASILLTLPGNPFLYYGEEIGLEGKKPDEHIREPMIWSNEKDAEGQSTWIVSQYNKETDAKAVATQLEDPNSLLNHYKSLIYARRSDEVLIKGEIENSKIREDGILAFKRVLDKKEKLVLHNLTNKEKTIDLGKTDFNIIYFASKKEADLKDQSLKIPAYSTVILNVK